MIFLVSCNEDLTLVSPEVEKEMPSIFFEIQGVIDNSGKTKSLIESTELLQQACTPAAQGGSGQSIGLWADRTENSTTVSNILGKNTQIIYDPTTTSGNPYNSWNYAGDPKKWNTNSVGVDPGVYKFRAYFPQSTKIVESSNATNFIVDFNTSTEQVDLLVAYNLIEASKFDLYTPVPLRFKHALSALQFQLKFKDGYLEDDALTSFWLQNGVTEDFSNVGMMVYGLTDEAIGLNEPEGIRWTGSSQEPYYHKMYNWENSKGVPFGNKEGITTIATAYTLPESTNEGKKYAQNEGWILIIPQKSAGTVSMNFTTKKGGATVYTIPLPKITGTDDEKENPSGEYFLPGYRYTYTFTLTKTHADVTLGIAPWNELDSSYDIPYY